MVHFPIVVFLRRALELTDLRPAHPAGDLLVLAGAFGLVLVCAAVLYYWVERPMRTRLRDSLGFLSPADAVPAGSPRPR
jgi:peptidoglycan/LPS O-acetylase OafA/YrhL